MRSSRTRFWTLGLVGTVTLALILAGCEGTLAPTSTLPPTSTAIPTLTPAPTSTAIPTLTAAPMSTAIPTLTAAPMSTAIPTLTAAPTATPVPMPTPISTLEPSPRLLEKLSLIPAYFKNEGVWYGDIGRALEIASVQAPRNRDDLTQSDSVRDAYWDARSGIVLAPGFLGVCPRNNVLNDMRH